jgi:hypothetical protein
MKNRKKLSDEILTTTMLIQSEHPELIKYLDEMPVTIPVAAEPVISSRSLNEYNESLKFLLANYSKD